MHRRAFLKLLEFLLNSLQNEVGASVSTAPASIPRSSVNPWNPAEVSFSLKPHAGITSFIDPHLSGHSHIGRCNPQSIRRMLENQGC